MKHPIQQVRRGLAHRCYRTVDGRPEGMDRSTRWLQTVVRQPALRNALGVIGPANLTIGHSHRLIFYRIAKCGTRSTLAALEHAGVQLDMGHAFNVYDARVLLPDYVRFTFVRDPVARFESCWRDKVARSNRPNFGLDASTHEKLAADIEAFIDFAGSLDLDTCDVHLRRQTALCDIGEMTIVGRMEHYGRDLARVFHELRLPLKVVPRENETAGVRRPALSKSAIHNIENLYARDMDKLGY